MPDPRRPALFASRPRPGMRPPAAGPTPDRPPRWRIVDQTDDAPAELWLYDAIGEDFFGFGINAEQMCRDLADLAAEEILLRVNSPGGDYFDGIAIYNALVQHPAQVVAQVDGLAASAASFIIQAANRVVMGRGARVMIHDAIGYCVGNAADMQAMNETLDGISADIADLYHVHGGGGAKAWRGRMQAETWYSADESVAAGLADEVMPAPKKRGRGQDDRAAAAVGGMLAASWDLSSVFRYPDRAAPAVAAGFVGEAGPELVDLPAGAVVPAAGEPAADEPEPAATVQPEPVQAALEAETSLPTEPAVPLEVETPGPSGDSGRPDGPGNQDQPPEPEPVEPVAAEPEPAAEPAVAATAGQAFPAGRPTAPAEPDPVPDPWAALIARITAPPSRPATVDDLLAALRGDTT